MNKFFLSIFLLTTITFLKASVIKLTDTTYENQIENKNKSIIIFSATWCGVCRKMKPIYHEVSNSLVGDVLFGEIDTDKNRKSTKYFNIEYLPTVILFEHGKEIKRANFLNKIELISFIKNKPINITKFSNVTSSKEHKEEPSKWITFIYFFICFLIIKKVINFYNFHIRRYGTSNFNTIEK